MCQDKKKARVSCKVLYNKELVEGIYEMVIINDEIPKATLPGQFVNLYVASEAMLLPRPISICEVNVAEGWIKLVYAVVGKGTEALAKLTASDEVEVLGPLGNGYTVEAGEAVLLVGGGVGTPPLLELAKRIQGKKTIVLGFRSNPYLVEALKQYGDVHVATDDGSVGFHGNVVALMKEKGMSGQQLYACGPKPMLKAVQVFAMEKGIPAQLSLEERMGCGFGACVGCVCKIKADNEVGYTYKKVCKDGPVFSAEEVLFE